MTAGAKRVFWSEAEKTLLGQQMHELLGADPELSLLKAVRLAQQSLPADRQREIITWSVVEPTLGPKLALAREAGNSGTRASTSAAAQDSDNLPPEGSEVDKTIPLEAARVAGAAEGQTKLDRPERSAESPQGEDPYRLAVESTGVQRSEAASGIAPGATVSTETTRVVEPAAQAFPSVQALTPATPTTPTTPTTPATLATPGTSSAPTSPRKLRSTPAVAAEPVDLSGDQSADRSLDQSVGHTASVPAVDPLQLEAAWLAAMQSPVVERALTELLSKAMAKAFSSMSQGEPSGASRASFIDGSSARVLVAGFSTQQVKPLEDALSQTCEVRVWKLGQTPQLLETLAKICVVAVVPDSASDEMDDFLKSLGVRVLRHEGSPGRIVDRVQSCLA